MADGFVSVFDKALVKEERSGEAAVDNGGSPAAFEHGSDATEVEYRFCAFKAFAPGTEGGQESGAQRGSAIYFSVKDIEGVHASLHEKGVEFKVSPHVVNRSGRSETWLAEFVDPDGNQLALLSEKTINAA